MPDNSLAPPNMPWLWQPNSPVGQPNGLGPPMLNYAAPPNPAAPTVGQGVAQTAQTAWQWLQDQRAESVRQGLLDPDTGLPTQKGLVEGARATAEGVMMGTTAPGDVPPPGIRAYHGSPHSFDQFDTSKIGTGEGAQAYGHGLYFAGNEGVAKTYKFANQPAYMNTATANVAQDAYQQAVKSGATDPLAAARNSLWEQRNVTDDPIARRRIDDAYNNIEQLTQPGGAGHMYEVNIGADPEHFLDWDKPLSEQSQHVQDALNKNPQLSAIIRGQDHSTIATAGDWVRRTTTDRRTGEMDPAELSLLLHQAGIPGISYLDAGSRSAGTGTQNHVVFDAKTIDILRKYGIAGLIAGGGAAAAGTQQQQPSQ